MSSLRSIIEKVKLKNIRTNISLHDGDIEVYYTDVSRREDDVNLPEYGEMINKETNTVFSPNEMKYLEERCCDIAEKHDFDEDYYTCVVSLNIDDQGLVSGSATYCVEEDTPTEIDSDLTIEGIQDKLDANQEAKDYLNSLGETISVHVHYSGGADSGEIDYASLERLDQYKINDEDPEPDLLENPHAKKLIDSIISDIGYDWWNNDGGTGDVQIDISKGKVAHINAEAFYYVRTPVEVDTIAINQGLIDFLIETDIEHAITAVDGNEAVQELLDSQWQEYLAGDVFDPLEGESASLGM